MGSPIATLICRKFVQKGCEEADISPTLGLRLRYIHRPYAINTAFYYIRRYLDIIRSCVEGGV